MLKQKTAIARKLAGMGASVADYEATVAQILVNNAGVTRYSLATMMTDEAYDTVLDINLKGAFNMIHHCTGLFLRAREGCIVNTSSVSGLMGNASQCNYVASRAALISLTKSIAKELAPRGVRCSAVALGFIRTDMTRTQEDSPLLRQIPLSRMGEPEEIAEAVAYLVRRKICDGRSAARGQRYRHVM